MLLRLSESFRSLFRCVVLVLTYPVLVLHLEWLVLHSSGAQKRSTWNVIHHLFCKNFGAASSRNFCLPTVAKFAIDHKVAGLLVHGAQISFKNIFSQSAKSSTGNQDFVRTCNFLLISAKFLGVILLCKIQSGLVMLDKSGKGKRGFEVGRESLTVALVLGGVLALCFKVGVAWYCFPRMILLSMAFNRYVTHSTWQSWFKRKYCP